MKTFFQRIGDRWGVSPSVPTGQYHAGRRAGQSTVELALILPILAGLLFLIIYVFRANHTANDQTVSTYAERITKFNHGNGEIFDPITQTYLPAGQYSEHIPPDAVIDLGQLAQLVTGLVAQLGLSELFSNLHIFDDTTYLGAFGEGFTYSLANSAASTFIETGSLHDMSASDLESAAWAGAASSFSSQAATEDFQGGEGASAGTITGTQELFGSGAQAGLIGFAQSEGDWKAGASSAMGGMINSDTSKEWLADGSTVEQILKGAGKGAVQSSLNGVFSDNLDAKSVLIGAASGAVNTNAFASTLAPNSDDPMGSTAFGAFNGAFSSVISGGDMQTTLLAAGAGAMGSSQTVGALGGASSLGYRAASLGYGAGTSLLSGESIQAVGMSALAGLGSSAVGWAGSKIAPSITNTFSNTNTSSDISQALSNQDTADAVASDETFDQSTDEILDGVNSGMMDGEYLRSLFLWLEEGTT